MFCFNPTIFFLNLNNNKLNCRYEINFYSINCLRRKHTQNDTLQKLKLEIMQLSTNKLNEDRLCNAAAANFGRFAEQQ